jgi:hypothetical protein
MENPYSWSTGKLLDEFMNACAHAGVSGSGLVISFSGDSDHSKAHYLRSVLCARLDRFEPPIKPGDKVQSRARKVTPLPRNGYTRNPRELPKTLTVEKVYYFGGNWRLEFLEKDESTADQDGVYAEDGGDWWWIPLMFKAEDFELKESVPA